MPRKDPPTEEEIREQMKLVGLDNLGKLVSEAAKHLKSRNDIEAQWYIMAGTQMIFVVKEPFD